MALGVKSQPALFVCVYVRVCACSCTCYILSSKNLYFFVQNWDIFGKGGHFGPHIFQRVKVRTGFSGRGSGWGSGRGSGCGSGWGSVWGSGWVQGLVGRVACE